MRESPSAALCPKAPKKADFGIVNPEELEIVSIS
jgi:hypothetical protein